MTNDIDIKNWEKKFDKNNRKVYAWTGSERMNKQGFPMYIEFDKGKMFRDDVPHLESGDEFWFADFIHEPRNTGRDLEAGKIAWGKDFDDVKDALKKWMEKNKIVPSVPSQGLKFTESTYVDKKKKKLNEEVL